MTAKKTNAKVATKSTAKGRAAKRQAAVQSNKAHIVVNKMTADGAYVYVENGAGESFTRLRSGDTKEFKKLSAIGQPFAAALKYHRDTPVTKPKAQLANGITAKDAPQSAKAVADQKTKPAKAENKGKARTEKAPKNKAPSRGASRAYKLGARKDESKPDTFRRYMLSTIMAHKDTDSAKAAHAKSKQYPNHKLDFNWAAQQGYIAFTK